MDCASVPSCREHNELTDAQAPRTTRLLINALSYPDAHAVDLGFNDYAKSATGVSPPRLGGLGQLQVPYVVLTLIYALSNAQSAHLIELADRHRKVWEAVCPPLRRLSRELMHGTQTRRLGTTSEPPSNRTRSSFTRQRRAFMRAMCVLITFRRRRA